MSAIVYDVCVFHSDRGTENYDSDHPAYTKRTKIRTKQNTRVISELQRRKFFESWPSVQQLNERVTFRMETDQNKMFVRCPLIELRPNHLHGVATVR